MQVVILAGGIGSRLRPVTHYTPKPMILIHGKPFVQHLFEFIKSFDLKDILLLVGYLGNNVEDYFGNGAKFDLNIKYSYEEILLGTGGALKNAEDELAKEFLLLNGDTYLEINYTELIKYFHQWNKIGLVTVYDNLNRFVPNNIAVDNLNFVVVYSKKDPARMTHVDAGAMIFKKDVLRLIPKKKFCSLEKVFDKLIRVKELVAFPTSQEFYDIGTPEGLKIIERTFP